MKRKFKRIASLVLATVMVFAMAMPAMAESEAQSKSGSLTLTVNDTDKGHKYVAYQIFKGDVLVKGDPAEGTDAEDKTFSNAEWGSVATTEVQNALRTAFADELRALDEAVYSDKQSAAALLKAIDTSTKSAEDKIKLIIESVVKNKGVAAGQELGESEGKYTTTVTPGYYLIIDESKTGEGGIEAGDVSSSYIVEVVGDTSVNPKKEKPTSGKEVLDVNDTDGGDGTWQDSADYDIGDLVKFRLKGTVAKDYQSYTNAYKFIFHDTQGTGLSMPSFDDIKVYVGTSAESADVKFEKTEGAEAKGKYYRIVKNPGTDDCTFEIIFDDLRSVDDLAGKEIIIEYTSKLNENAEIGNDGNPNTLQLEYSSNPEGDGTNKTPENKTVVFTYELDVDKIKEDGSTLAGAEFTLYKKLADGAQIPEGGQKLNKPGDPYDGWLIVEAKTLTGEAIGADTTTFDFKGLDDGDYALVETKTPAGYNTAEPIEFTITAEHSESEKLTKLEVTKDKGLTANKEAGELTGAKQDGSNKEMGSGEIWGEIINRAGATLPETGGIGTTIFYVVGSVLVLGAVILLVTKRRMKG